MKTLFFGTPLFAVQSLVKLAENSEIKAIVTKPDKPAGRGLNIKISPVKKTAQDLGLEFYQPEDLNQMKEEYEKINPDLSVVVAYGKVLPDWILNNNKGAINIHASILPKYRGAAPIQRAIMNGDKETGVTIQKMVTELDAGDVLAAEKVEIIESDTSGTLHDKLAIVAAPLLVKVVNDFDNISMIKQDEEKATWAKKIEKEEAVIDWNKTNVEINNLVRALNPFPGAKSTLKNKQIKVYKTELNEREGKPGQVLEVNNNEFIIGCAKGSLNLAIIQPTSKNKIKGFEFARNYNIRNMEMLI